MSSSTLTIQPLHDRVLVRLLEKERADGLVIIRERPDCVDLVGDGPQHSDHRRVGFTGVVVAVGPGKLDEKFKFRATRVKPGEVVTFSAWDDLDGRIPGHCMIREGDIWGYGEA